MRRACQSRGYGLEFAKLAYRIDDAQPLASLKAAFARMPAAYAFPEDEEFKRALLEGDLYHKREPPRVYRRAKLSENCPLWNRHQRRRPRSRIHLSSASVRCGWRWNTAMSIKAKLRR